MKEVQSVSKLEISLPCIKKKLWYNFQVSWSFVGKKSNVLVLNISFFKEVKLKNLVDHVFASIIRRAEINCQCMYMYFLRESVKG